MCMCAACFHPDLEGTYILQLDTSFDCVASSTTVTVTAACPTAPTPVISLPTSAIALNENKATVTVDASMSVGSGPLTYQWSFVRTSHATVSLVRSLVFSSFCHPRFLSVFA